MNKCTYVRKMDGGYEYGYQTIKDSGEKKEKREHIALGNRPTLEEALSANQMALKGMPRIGHTSHHLEPLWRD
jgi:hypothetical protein